MGISYVLPPPPLFSWMIPSDQLRKKSKFFEHNLSSVCSIVCDKNKAWDLTIDRENTCWWLWFSAVVQIMTDLIDLIVAASRTGLRRQIWSRLSCALCMTPVPDGIFPFHFGLQDYQIRTKLQISLGQKRCYCTLLFDVLYYSAAFLLCWFAMDLLKFPPQYNAATSCL